MEQELDWAMRHLNTSTSEFLHLLHYYHEKISPSTIPLMSGTVLQFLSADMDGLKRKENSIISATRNAYPTLKKSREGDEDLVIILYVL